MSSPPTNELLAYLSAFFLARGAPIQPTQIPTGSLPLAKLAEAVATQDTLVAAVQALQLSISAVSSSAATASGGNAASILSLQAALSSLQSAVSLLQTTVGGHGTRISAIEAELAAGLDTTLSVDDGAGTGTITLDFVNGLLTAATPVP